MIWQEQLKVFWWEKEKLAGAMSQKTIKFGSCFGNPRFPHHHSNNSNKLMFKQTPLILYMTLLGHQHWEKELGFKLHLY